MEGKTAIDILALLVAIGAAVLSLLAFNKTRRDTDLELRIKRGEKLTELSYAMVTMDLCTERIVRLRAIALTSFDRVAEVCRRKGRIKELQEVERIRQQTLGDLAEMKRSLQESAKTRKEVETILSETNAATAIEKIETLHRSIKVATEQLLQKEKDMVQGVESREADLKKLEEES